MPTLAFNRLVSLRSVLLLALGGAGFATLSGHLSQAAPVPTVSGAGLLPSEVTFRENRGQLPATARFHVRGADKSVYFGADGLTYSLSDPNAGTRWNVKLDFVGAEPTCPVGEAARPGRYNYLTGTEKPPITGVRGFATVRYPELWHGIDLVYQGESNRMKHEFQVAAGADASVIRLAYRGADAVRINEVGQLVVHTPAGDLADDRPAAYQEIAGRRVDVPVEYALSPQPDGRVEYGFRLGTYDARHALVIDPAVLIYCGFIGGEGADTAFGVAVDTEGSAYVTGRTTSGPDTFPVQAGLDSTLGGDQDAFVAKIAPNGSFVYCTYLGGSDIESGYSIAVDNTGAACVGGYTYSTDFPVTVGPALTFQGDPDSFTEGWVARLDPTGTALDYCGFVGGTGDDYVNMVAVDGDQRLYFTGASFAPEAQDGFPLVAGPGLVKHGEDEAFVGRVAANGAAFEYCGYISGSGDEAGFGIAVLADGSAWVSGATASAQATFPVTGGPDLTFNGVVDAFIARVSPDGGSLLSCGYLGGAGDDAGLSVAARADGRPVVAGYTSSLSSTFPVAVGPDLTANGDYDGFVAGLTVNGATIEYCGFLGGKLEDSCNGVALDGDGNAYVTGETSSPAKSFPEVAGPDLRYHGGEEDAFVARVKSTGTGLDYCGYVGGNFGDYGVGIAVDADGSAYVAGETRSNGTAFPARVGPSLSYQGGIGDGFIAKIGPLTPAPVPAGVLQVKPASLKFGTVRIGSPRTKKILITNRGSGPLNVNIPQLAAPFTVSAPGNVTLAPRAKVSLDVTFAPTTASTRYRGLALTSDDPKAPLKLVPITGKSR